MSNLDDHAVTAATVGAAFVASTGCAWILHTAPDRAAAAYVLPVAVTWGIAAVWFARHLRLTSLAWLFVASILVRAPLVGTPLYLSDDVFRYLFEGVAMNAGHNPFVTPPNLLIGVADHLQVFVNHPHVTTVYPPAALWWFRLLAVVGTPWFAQLMTAIVDSVIPVLILAGARRAGPAWIYALHPLPALESAAGAHVDVLAVAAAAGGVVAWRRGRGHTAWWLFWLGTWLKLLPAALLATVARSVRRPLVLLLGACLGTVALAWPVLRAGSELLAGLSTYAGTWAFNGFLFSWLPVEHEAIVRPVLVAAGALVTVWALWRHRDPARAWAVIGAGFLVLSPTVHPWYALWAIVPGLLNNRVGWAAAGVALLMSYSVLRAYDPVTGLWSEAPWLWWITWGPIVAVLSMNYLMEWTATAPYPAANSSRKGNEAT